MEAIGAYYENSLSQVMGPGAGPNGSDGYFVPNPDANMDCGTLKKYMGDLDNQIQYWYGVIRSGNNNNRELENLNKILNVQETKRLSYSNLIINNCTIIPETPIPSVPTNTANDPLEQFPAETPPSNGSSTNYLLIGIIAVAAGLAFLPRKKKRGQKKKVSGVNGNTIPLLGLGTFIAFDIVKHSNNQDQQPAIVNPIQQYQ